MLVSIATGAQGAYNQYFQTLGENLVKFNLSTALLRIGWEFNGDWYKWTALPGCSHWATYYAQIVTTMRAVPGKSDPTLKIWHVKEFFLTPPTLGNNFKTIWNPNGGYNAVNAPDCWPGDEYVDYVGVDSYDIDYGSYNWESTQPFGSWSPMRLSVINDSMEHNVSIWKALVNSTNVEPGTDDTVWTLLANSTTLQSLRQKAWDTIHSGYLGLEFWANFACNHSKPLILNEWGVWANVRGGFDNDYYIERMHEFIMNETNNVAIYAYFDVLAFDGDHRLRPETNFPRASQKFWELFGVHEQPSPDGNSPTDQNSPTDSNGEVPSSTASPQAMSTPSSQLRSCSSAFMYYIPTMIAFVLLVLWKRHPEAVVLM